MSALLAGRGGDAPREELVAGANVDLRMPRDERAQASQAVGAAWAVDRERPWLHAVLQPHAV